MTENLNFSIYKYPGDDNGVFPMNSRLLMALTHLNIPNNRIKIDSIAINKENSIEELEFDYLGNQWQPKFDIFGEIHSGSIGIAKSLQDKFDCKSLLFQDDFEFSSCEYLEFDFKYEVEIPIFLNWKYKRIAYGTEIHFSHEALQKLISFGRNYFQLVIMSPDLSSNQRSMLIAGNCYSMFNKVFEKMFLKLESQNYLGGNSPKYIDYIVFCAVKWAIFRGCYTIGNERVKVNNWYNKLDSKFNEISKLLN